MIDEREIWACANALINRHGPAAWFAAAKRAEELLDLGELEGNRVFRAIMHCIEQLEALETPDVTQ
ncbi:hypothetical protein [Sphingomonas soli]|uniref:hypothetical protein n=1 Tax=Sphingomonas soli TaxID=266127 RepID=UPI0008365633|nr:hypothetical protein [Sphingomonas soli]